MYACISIPINLYKNFNYWTQNRHVPFASQELPVNYNSSDPAPAPAVPQTEISAARAQSDADVGFATLMHIGVTWRDGPQWPHSWPEYGNTVDWPHLSHQREIWQLKVCLLLRVPRAFDQCGNKLSRSIKTFHRRLHIRLPQWLLHPGDNILP